MLVPPPARLTLLLDVLPVRVHVRTLRTTLSVRTGCSYFVYAIDLIINNLTLFNHCLTG
jgi:hypothetical protein